LNHLQRSLHRLSRNQARPLLSSTRRPTWLLRFPASTPIMGMRTRVTMGIMPRASTAPRWMTGSTLPGRNIATNKASDVLCLRPAGRTYIQPPTAIPTHMAKAIVRPTKRLRERTRPLWCCSAWSASLTALGASFSCSLGKVS
jgi:hypothetical protein